MATARYDAVVIGGGHNGLVAATLLAKAKQRVLLVEASDRLGGLAASREIMPGVQAPSGPAFLHLFSPEVARRLDLTRHGLKMAEPEMETVAIRPGETPLPILAGDTVLAKVAPGDAERLPAFEARLARLAGPLAPFLDRVPPPLHAKCWSDRLEHLKLAFAVRRLGRRDMRDLLRIVAMNVADLAEEIFTHPAVQGAIAFDAVLGHAAGPRSPGTVFNLIRRRSGHAFGKPGSFALPRGGMGAVVDAIAAAARAAGVEIRTGAPATRIHVTNGHVEGLALASGEEIAASNLLSSADPRRTLLDLLGPSYLDTNLVRELRCMRGDGINAKINLVLGALPEFGLPAERLRRARLVLAPSLAQLERAHDTAKYGGVPETPALEAVIPTLADPTLAPPGKHLLSITVQYTPRRLANDDWAARREALGDRVTTLLDDCAPGLSRLVEAREILTPLDIERESGTHGGHWHHVEAGLDRTFWLRPAPQLAQYRTPFGGLYLCGAGSHPGGGVSGAAGANAARAALSDFRRPRR